MTNEKQIKIFDTTLRDGQQCPGAGMSFERNVEYARLAAAAKVDVMEAGFPAASKLDAEIVETIAREVGACEGGPIIAGLCQLRREQVELTISALQPAIPFRNARLHTYVPVDPELMVASLGKRAERKSEIVKDVSDFISLAAKAGCEVEFSPEGYSRMGSNFDFVTDLILAAVEAGASVINCPDTIGGASRFQGSDYFVEKMNLHAEIVAKRFPGRSITWSVHCHNDFGMALDNSLQAVFAGPATQVEGCFNGIGERAGNVALEQVIFAINHFGRTSNSACRYVTGIDTKHIQGLSDFIRRHMLPRQPHWPIVGDNATKHSSGGHTNAILKNPMAYQPFDPREIGKEITVVFGPLSGGNHAKALIESFGYTCADSEKAAIAQNIKNLYQDRRKGITDDELISGYVQYRSPIKVKTFDYRKEAKCSSVILTGELFGRHGVFERVHEGEDSALVALKELVEQHMGPVEILSHRAESEHEGAHARSLSTVVVRKPNQQTYRGTGADQDIEISAMKAFLEAANRAWVEENCRQDPKPFRLSAIEEGDA
jgi:2-isopropylmalate synthase